MNTKNLSIKMLAISLLVLAGRAQAFDLTWLKSLFSNTTQSAPKELATPEEKEAAIAEVNVTIQNLAAASETSKKTSHIWLCCIGGNYIKPPSHCAEISKENNAAWKVTEKAHQSVRDLANRTCKGSGYRGYSANLSQALNLLRNEPEKKKRIVPVFTLEYCEQK